ncbi:MAG: DUF4397 domain-containing protein [Actinomycetota bacterium]
MIRFRTILAVLAALALSAVAFVAPASAQDSARIHLIHGIPDTDVDVEAGGDNVFEGFSFGDTQDLGALAGATLEGLKVKVAGTDTVAIDAGDVTLPDSGNTTIIAHLDADGAPTLSIFSNDTSQLGAGEGRLIVRHTAAAPEVDIKANGAVAFAGVANGEGGGADLPVGTVTAEVVPAGADEPVVIGPADLAIADGEALIVYAVGSLEDETLTVLTETISGLHSNPNAVNTGTGPINDGTSTTTLVAAVAALLAAGFAVFTVARPAFRRA